MSTKSHRSERSSGFVGRHHTAGLRSIARRRGQAGAADMVQLAILALFIALPLVVGIVEISVGFFNQAILTNASRAAAREAIRVPEPRVTPVNAALAAFNGARINWNGSGDLTAGMVQVTSSGSQVTVTLTYPHRFLLLPSFADGIANINLVARTDMRMRR